MPSLYAFEKECYDRAKSDYKKQIEKLQAELDEARTEINRLKECEILLDEYIRVFGRPNETAHSSMVEHPADNGEALGSSPSEPTKEK